MAKRRWKVGDSFPQRLTKAMGGSKTKKIGDKVLQEGMTIFDRKKKNACQLLSTAQIKRSINKGMKKNRAVGCVAAYKKIPLERVNLPF